MTPGTPAGGPTHHLQRRRPDAINAGSKCPPSQIVTSYTRVTSDGHNGAYTAGRWTPTMTPASTPATNSTSPRSFLNRQATRHTASTVSRAVRSFTAPSARATRGSPRTTCSHSPTKMGSCTLKPRRRKSPWRCPRECSTVGQ